MSKKQGIANESSIYQIENGFLLTYVVVPYNSTVSLSSLEHKTEYYKAGFEATERLAEILLKELAQEIDFMRVGTGDRFYEGE